MKNLLHILLISSLFIGCSSNNDDDTTPEDTTPILLTKYNVEYKNGDTDETILKYDGDKILEISYSDGSKDVYTYDGDNISKLTTYKDNGEIDETFENYYTNGKLSKTIDKSYFGSAQPITYNYIWLSDNHMQYENNNNGVTSENDLYYQDGNLIKEVSVVNFTSSQRNETTSTYDYDSNINPYSNIRGFSKANVEFQDQCSKNNIIRETSVSKTYTNNVLMSTTTTVDDHTFEINNQKYPTKETIKSTYQNTVYKYFYNK